MAHPPAHRVGAPGRRPPHLILRPRPGRVGPRSPAVWAGGAGVYGRYPVSRGAARAPRSRGQADPRTPCGADPGSHSRPRCAPPATRRRGKARPPRSPCGRARPVTGSHVIESCSATWFRGLGAGSAFHGLRVQLGDPGQSRCSSCSPSGLMLRPKWPIPGRPFRTQLVPAAAPVPPRGPAGRRSRAGLLGSDRGDARPRVHPRRVEAAHRRRSARQSG